MNNYQNEVQKLHDLSSELNNLKEKLEQEPTSELGGHPPLWSGEIQDLGSFTNELREWLDEPKLKEAKDIIKKFQLICEDKRNFPFDDNKSYFISILDILTQGKDILSNIDNDNIKQEASRAILDRIFQQTEEEELKIEIDKIREFWDGFNDKIGNFDTKDNDFIEEVKNDGIENLIKSLKTGFNGDEINDVYLKMEKAKKLREVLKEIDSRALLSEYKKKKDIDGIWDISNEIRKKLDITNVDVVGIPEDRKIFVELVNCMNSRNNALQESDLIGIKKKLDNIFGDLKIWGEKVNRFMDMDITQLDTWFIAIGNYKNNSKRIQEITFKITELKRKFASLRFDDVKDSRTKELYDVFEEYYKLRRDVEDIFKDLLSDDAIAILNNLSNLEKLRREKGDTFWIAAKELCDAFSRLKIKLEWGKG